MYVLFEIRLFFQIWQGIVKITDTSQYIYKEGCAKIGKGLLIGLEKYHPSCLVKIDVKAKIVNWSMNESLRFFSCQPLPEWHSGQLHPVAHTQGLHVSIHVLQRETD